MMENGHNPVLETEICHNCKKEVPQQNYLIHVSHCARNVIICPICQEPIVKANIQKHNKNYHKKVSCPICKKEVESGELEVHKKEKCPKRLCICEFCDLELPYGELQDHIYHCGARTDKCEECGELVMLKYQKIHRESNHGFIKLNDEPGPTPSWQSSTPSSRSTNVTSRGTNPPSTRRISFNNLEPLRDTLPAATANVVQEKTPCQREIEREERENSGSSGIVPPRDQPRTFVPAYDASEDLRAKVRLAKLDMKNIRRTVLAGEERVKELSNRARQNNTPDLTATTRRPPPVFQTNLVPFEKNKSYAVNALPLAVNPASLGTPPVVGPNQRLFTYLGAPTTAQQQNGGLSIATNPTGSQNRGAVPKLHKKTKGPAPQPPKGGSAGLKNAPDGLPCEFCGKLVQEDQFVLHETACRPDLAQLKIPAAPLAGATPPSPEVELPCEFCCSLVKASKLLSHQALCDG